MVYSKFESIAQMQKYFRERIEKSNSTAIIGGHFALEPQYFQNKLEVRAGIEEDDRFGIFPLVTLDYASQLIAFGKSRGKNCKLSLLVDDHSLMNPRTWYAQSDSASLEIRTAVEKYFKDFQLPKKFTSILNSYGLEENDLFVAKNGKPVFQEHLYREEFIQRKGTDLGCSGEFQLIIEEIVKKGFDNLLGYIPLRCRQPTCGALVTASIGLKLNSSSQYRVGGDLAYFVTDSALDNRDLFEKAHDDANHGLVFFNCSKD